MPLLILLAVCIWLALVVHQRRRDLLLSRWYFQQLAHGPAVPFGFDCPCCTPHGSRALVAAPAAAAHR